MRLRKAARAARLLTGQDIALGALAAPIRHVLATYYPTRTFCRAIEVTNARTGGLTYEMATCEAAFSRTTTLAANGRKIPRPRPDQADAGYNGWWYFIPASDRGQRYSALP